MGNLAILCIMVVTVLVTTVRTQDRPTLREFVRKSGADVVLVHNVCGPWTSTESLVRRTDLIVQAVIGSGTGHLTNDGADVYTTFELLHPQVFHAERLPMSRQLAASARLELAQRGGVTTVDGFNVTVKYADGPQLAQGMEVVALLDESDGRYWPVSCDRKGLFEVRNSLVYPLIHWTTGDKPLAGISPAALAAEIMSLKRLQQKLK